MRTLVKIAALIAALVGLAGIVMLALIMIWSAASIRMV